MTSTTSEITSEARRLIVVGSGSQELWAPVFAALAEQYELVTIDRDYPTWQGSYAKKHRIADITNSSMLFHAVADLRGEVADASVITWNPHSVLPLAVAARKLRIRYFSPDAVSDAADTLEVRAAVAEAGLPVVPWQLFYIEDDVVGAGERIGYPVVLRARRRGTAGVSYAASEGDLREAFVDVAGRSAAGVVADDGVLIEQYIDGTELNVHSAVSSGRAVPIAAVRAIFDADDPLRATGYEAQSLAGESWSGQVEEVVGAVHSRLGIDFGVTNTTLRVTADGLRVIGVDTCLTGELIGALGTTGIDLVKAAAAIGFEREPVLSAAGSVGGLISLS
ncbi:ATP-grasp domain-containing protein [Dactylosporangium sp. NPDC051484]|uniref:ATP-grasp domain-containing protein n=1 Tax=Dactylosporangium sp. NPDC051484 TaxID=3154942 RepID=UPI00344FF946